MSEYGGSDYFDNERFSGKSIDEELDREEEVDAEEKAEDLKQAHLDIADGLPSEFNETIEDVIDTFEVHYDPSVPEWNEIADELTKVMADMERSDEDEFMEREDEFADILSGIKKQAERLIPTQEKKKTA